MFSVQCLMCSVYVSCSVHDSGRLECAETQSEEGGAVGKSLTGEVSSSLQRVSSSLWREGRLCCEGVVVFVVKGLSSLV